MDSFGYSQHFFLVNTLFYFSNKNFSLILVWKLFSVSWFKARTKWGFLIISNVVRSRAKSWHCHLGILSAILFAVSKKHMVVYPYPRGTLFPITISPQDMHYLNSLASNHLISSFWSSSILFRTYPFYFLFISSYFSDLSEVIRFLVTHSHIFGGKHYSFLELLRRRRSFKRLYLLPNVRKIYLDKFARLMHNACRHRIEGWFSWFIREM